MIPDFLPYITWSSCSLPSMSRCKSQGMPEPYGGEKNSQVQMSDPLAWGQIEVKKSRSLISKTTPLATIGTQPVNGIAGHSPKILLHAVGAYLEAAAADPAKGLFLAARVTLILPLVTAYWLIALGFLGCLHKRYFLIICKGVRSLQGRLGYVRCAPAGAPISAR